MINFALESRVEIESFVVRLRLDVDDGIVFLRYDDHFWINLESALVSIQFNGLQILLRVRVKLTSTSKEAPFSKRIIAFAISSTVFFSAS